MHFGAVMLHLHSAADLADKPAIAAPWVASMEDEMTADLINRLSAALASTVITVATLSPFAILSLLV